MDLRVDIVTLAVPDLDEAHAFYVDRLGWKPAFEVAGEVTFLWAGARRIVALFARADLANDMGVDNAPPFDLGHNCTSAAEVDEIVAAMRAAGATVVKEPQQAFWGGYHGYVEAPDGTVWEIAHNPAWTMDGDGIVQLST